MVCPTCQTNNREGVLTCTACGSPLKAETERAGLQALATGTKLQQGACSIGKVLGQGGFGITYLGSDVRLRRPVAVKEFFPLGCMRHGTTVQPSGSITSNDYQSAKSKFVEEARVLTPFEFHPNIVHVYYSFEENNTAYMVMEFLKGKTLMKLIEERGALPDHEAVGYVVKVGDALKAVHKKNFLHRDIKPDNVMITEDDRTVLFDFGSALTFAAGMTKRMTKMEADYLTPGYTPLEQYGQQDYFGVYTDIYALGATLYHMLTGELPVQATDRACGVELLPPDKIKPTIRRTVSDAVMWALKIKCDERPQSIQEFIDALEGHAVPKRS